jgi:hypothetical protein
LAVHQDAVTTTKQPVPKTAATAGRGPVGMTNDGSSGCPHDTSLCIVRTCVCVKGSSPASRCSFSLAYYMSSSIIINQRQGKQHKIIQTKTYRMMDERSGSKFIRIAVRRHVFDHRATVRVFDGRRRSTLIVQVGFVEKVILLGVVATTAWLLLLQQPVRLVIVVVVVVVAVVRRGRHLGDSAGWFL